MSQLTLPPPRVLKSILCVCVFIPALPLGSSVPFFLDSIYDGQVLNRWIELENQEIKCDALTPSPPELASGNEVNGCSPSSLCWWQEGGGPGGHCGQGKPWDKGQRREMGRRMWARHQQLGALGEPREEKWALRGTGSLQSAERGV